jgi:tryptophan synthase alpha chain
VRYVDRLSSGFLYLVSSEATTGGTFELNESRGREFERIRRVVTNNPLMLGFGIKDRETMQAAFRHADGVIVGSAFIRALQAGTAHSDAKKFLQSLLEK